MSADAGAESFFALCDILVCAFLSAPSADRPDLRLGGDLPGIPSFLEFSAAGHLDPLMLLGLLAGLDLWESGHRELSALAWAGAALVKVVPIVLLPWLILRRPRAAALFVAVVALGLLPALPGLQAALAGTSENGMAAFASGWLANPSLHAFVSSILSSESSSRVFLSLAVAATSVPWARFCGDGGATSQGCCSPYSWPAQSSSPGMSSGLYRWPC